MKKQEYIKLMACWFVLLMLQFQPIHAQRISHNFRNTSMSEALTTLAKSTRDYRINFMYNELEDFTVTTHIVKRTAPEAIEQIIGFYPMKMTIDGKNIFVECTQKTPTKMIGRVVDVQHHPVDFANVSLLNVQDSSFITGGVTNENGQFVIPCEIRKAIVKVSCVGYQTQTRTFDTGKIGSITLKEATMHLQKVVVKSSRPVVAIKGNALVTTVANSQLEHAGTANDVLRQIPMVTGRDGNFEVFGKGTLLMVVPYKTRMNFHSSIRKTSRMWKSSPILVPSMTPPSSLLSVFAPNCHKVKALEERFVRKMVFDTISLAWSKPT